MASTATAGPPRDFTLAIDRADLGPVELVVLVQAGVGPAREAVPATRPIATGPPIDAAVVFDSGSALAYIRALSPGRVVVEAEVPEAAAFLRHLGIPLWPDSPYDWKLP